jgi:signal transduction histidine kinase
VGLGETGETYLIGDDFMMRNQSRFLVEDSKSYFEQVKRLGMNMDLLNTIKAKKSTILLQTVRTKGSEEAISGKTNIEIFPDYRNVSVLSAYAPLNIEDVKWAIMSEIDEEEALKPVIELTNNVLIVAGLSSILVVIAIILSTRIIKPIKTLIEGTKRVASGDLEHVINIGKSDDELKELCESFNLMMKELSKTTTENKQLFFQVKRSRDELDVKATELEKTYNELEDFVYIVSHDLKEPLFSIEGYRSRLLRSTKNTLDEKSKLHLERIKANVEIMSKKISEIMEVLKVGRVVYNFERHNANTIVDDVLRMLESKTTENNVNVIKQEDMPAKLMCDRERLKDVFSNLIINAIKFMSDDNGASSENGNGGFKEIRIGCESNGNYYKFFVEDTGIGVRSEYRDMIFKIFRRLNDVETEGSGVGLAIAKKIIEIHEGNIWVESPIREGRGSRFCFTIPISYARNS